jgi:hypothetical protein
VVSKMLGTILLIILILILIGALPTWPYSAGWGYYPSGGFGLLLVIVIILLLVGRIYSSSRSFAGGHQPLYAQFAATTGATIGRVTTEIASRRYYHSLRSPGS